MAIKYHELYDEFLHEFPLESLSSMTLERYTNRNNNSFCYWLEHKTRDLGSIAGRSSYKFCIYAYASKPKSKSANWDDTYTWYKRLNKNNAQDAFKIVRDELVKIANYAHEGNFAELDKLKNIFWPTVKWKIAFMYSRKRLLNINSEDALYFLSKQFGFSSSKKTPISEIQNFLWKQKGEQDLFEYCNKLWHMWSISEEKKKLDKKNKNKGEEISDNSVKVKKEDKYTDADFLKEVFIQEEDLKRLKALLKSKKNLILQGPPGVGKTYTAKRLAYTILEAKDDDHIAFVQFHQNYSYEDFVMGYKPDGNNTFTLKTGVFYNFCKKAQEKSGEKFFFIIDEINRGNVSKIFGELLMLIEKDYRGKKISLAYQKEGDELFTVPENIYIIGMMNTADRSLALIDYALRRRFCFYSMKPCFDRLLENYSNQRDTHLKQLIDKVKELNKKINESLGPGYEIGHSYFCIKDNEKIDDVYLENIIEYEIVPMLEEYWFDSLNKVSEWRQKLLESIGKVVTDKSNENASSIVES